MKQKRLNEYIITRDGIRYENTLYDTIIGYSTAREDVRLFKDRFPNHKWDCKKVDNKL